MEDNLKKNGRQPQKKWKTTSKNKMENDLKKKFKKTKQEMEDDLKKYKIKKEEDIKKRSCS
jgi:hypothetical protein